MKYIGTINGEIKWEVPITTSKAMNFLMKYPWERIGKVDQNHVVVEEVGRNTHQVFGFGYSGSPSEILPLLRFLYIRTALRTACFCSSSPDWREREVLSVAKELGRFPEKAKAPLSVLCSCTQQEEFRELAELLSANIEISPTPILLGQGVIPDWKFSVAGGNEPIIAMMLTYGISQKETIERGIQFVAKDYWKNDDHVIAALELHQEGACSFDEALAMA